METVGVIFVVGIVLFLGVFVPRWRRGREKKLKQ